MLLSLEHANATPLPTPNRRYFSSVFATGRMEATDQPLAS
jgi:hypothetical protein